MHKGGDNLYFDLRAGATYSGKFKGAFADAPEFNANAEGIFVITAKVPLVNPFDVIKVYGKAEVSLCDFGTEAEFRVMNVPMQIGKFSGEWKWPDSGNGQINQLRNQCRELMEIVNELREEANDRLSDAQNAVDFYRLYGEQLQAPAAKFIDVGQYAPGGPSLDPWTTEELDKLKQLPAGFAVDSCDDIMATYSQAAKKYFEKVGELQGTIADLAKKVKDAATADGGGGDGFNLPYVSDGIEKTKAAELSYSIGPFVVQGEFGGHFELGAEGSLNMRWGATWKGGAGSPVPGVVGAQGAMQADAGVGLTFAPHASADMQVALAAGVGNKFINAVGGIMGELELMSIKLPVTAGAEIKAGASTDIGVAVPRSADEEPRFLGPQYRLKYDYKWRIGANVILSALSGHFDAFARVKLGWFTKSWSKTLYDWAGITETIRLYSAALDGGDVSDKTTVPQESGPALANFAELFNAPAFPNLPPCDTLVGQLDASGLMPWNPAPVTLAKIEDIRDDLGDAEAEKWEVRLREQRAIWFAAFAQGKNADGDALSPWKYKRAPVEGFYTDPELKKPSDPRCDHEEYQLPPG